MPREQELARDSTPSPLEILSVSALNRSVRDLIEHRYPLLWVAGEISNYMLAKSGHAYFVLKDEHAQVRCVMFRHRHQAIDWGPHDGMQAEVQALVTLYEPRGDFQLNVESMRRAGQGALFEAFLRLRDRLAREGLFDAARKRPVPAYPRAVGVVTSLRAAALRDVLSTLARRNPSLPVVVYPVQVQGDGATQQISAALETAGRRKDCDVLLLVRGGGSIEDLRAFNDEEVARAIRTCPIPVITGVGHETDFTIADFAADRRAPTPTAAAELVSPVRTALLHQIGGLAARLTARATHEIQTRMQWIDHLSRGLIHPDARLRAQSRMLRQFCLRLQRASNRSLSERRWRLSELVQRGRMQLPNVKELSAHAVQLALRLQNAARAGLERAGTRCAGLAGSLVHLDPAAVLARGYSIVEKPGGTIVRDSATLAVGESVGIRFAKGHARARIDAKS